MAPQTIGEFVDFLDIQKVSPYTQPPTGRGKKTTPELHKVIWRAYRYVSTTIAENPTAQEVWDSLRADPMMFDPERIIICLLYTSPSPRD